MNSETLNYLIAGCIAIAGYMGFTNVSKLLPFIKGLPFLKKYFEKTEEEPTEVSLENVEPNTFHLIDYNPLEPADLLWVAARQLTQRGDKDAAKQAYDLALSLSSKEVPPPTITPNDLQSIIEAAINKTQRVAL